MAASPQYDLHEWLADNSATSYAVAGCVTLVAGVASDEAARRVGADLSGETPVGGLRHEAGLSWVSVLPADDASSDGAVLIEDNGWEGSRTEVLAALSKNGAAASVFWNVNGVVRFGCARRGKVLASVELPDPDDVEDLPSALGRIIQRAPSTVDPVALGALLAERFTGVALRHGPSILRPSTALPIVSPVLGLPVTPEELVGLDYPSRQVVEAVQSASVVQRRSLAEWATLKALGLAGLEGHPDVAPVVTQFGNGRPVRLSAEVSALRRVVAAGASGSRSAPKYWALNALTYTAVATASPPRWARRTAVGSCTSLAARRTTSTCTKRCISSQVEREHKVRHAL